MTLLVTTTEIRQLLISETKTPSAGTMFAWNATNGRLIQKLDLEDFSTQFDVDPDGKSVLIATRHFKAGKWQQVLQIWYPEEGGPAKATISMK